MTMFYPTDHSMNLTHAGLILITVRIRRQLRNSFTVVGWVAVFSICAMRPTGIYGLANPLENSKWFKLVEAVVRGADVQVSKGGKEVHVDDVALAIELLLGIDGVEGHADSCCDRYISEFDVAKVAKEIANSTS